MGGKPTVETKEEEEEQTNSKENLHNRQEEMNEELLECIDQLESDILELQGFKNEIQTTITEVKTGFDHKATEYVMAHYFNKVAQSLHRELGSAAHHDISKLQEDSKLDQIYQTDDSLSLQKAASQLSDKIEIIGLNIVNSKKKIATQGRKVIDIEKEIKNFIKLDFYRNEHEQHEIRIRDFVSDKVASLQANLDRQEKQL